MNLHAGIRFTEYFRQLQARLGINWLARLPAEEEAPLRAELFSTDQMEQHGKALAATHRLAPGRAPDQLLARLAANEKVLDRKSVV